MTQNKKKQTRGQVKLVTLFLMTEKGYSFLMDTVKRYKSLFELVVVGSDKSIKDDFEEKIIKFCIKEKIKYVKKSNFKEIPSEYAIAVSWRWLIRHPSQKLIVLHDSPLPKYRGFAPLVNALINGEKQIGVTAIFGADSFDSGQVVAQSITTISYPIKISTAIKINRKNYLKCATIVLDKLVSGLELEGVLQDEGEATYCVWRDDDDYKINWAKSSSEIKRFIDALGPPYKGASTSIDGRIIRILNAEEDSEIKIENRQPGKILFIKDGKPVVICGKGMLRIIDACIDGEGASSLPVSRLRVRLR